MFELADEELQWTTIFEGSVIGSAHFLCLCSMMFTASICSISIHLSSSTSNFLSASICGAVYRVCIALESIQFYVCRYRSAIDGCLSIIRFLTAHWQFRLVSSRWFSKSLMVLSISVFPMFVVYIAIWRSTCCLLSFRAVICHYLGYYLCAQRQWDHRDWYLRCNDTT